MCSILCFLPITLILLTIIDKFTFLSGNKHHSLRDSVSFQYMLVFAMFFVTTESKIDFPKFTILSKLKKNLFSKHTR
jgi:hypothetical protein